MTFHLWTFVLVLCSIDFFLPGNIYFTNSFDVEVFIEVARIDGSMRKVIVRESQGSPSAIAVNPIKRQVFIFLGCNWQCWLEVSLKVQVLPKSVHEYSKNSISAFPLKNEKCSTVFCLVLLVSLYSAFFQLSSVCYLVGANKNEAEWVQQSLSWRMKVSNNLPCQLCLLHWSESIYA